VWLPGAAPILKRLGAEARTREALGLGAEARTPEVTIHDRPAMRYRGSAEGFYGTPWSHADRLDHLTYLGAHKTNTYVYAPGRGTRRWSRAAAYEAQCRARCAGARCAGGGGRGVVRRAEEAEERYAGRLPTAPSYHGRTQQPSTRRRHEHPTALWSHRSIRLSARPYRTRPACSPCRHPLPPAP
jgi:hypothetical protein